MASNESERPGWMGRSADAAPAPLPSIQWPTGGGAIRGVDEALAVNSATGTAQLSIALPITAARG